jgi:hypothetical protein
MCTKTGLTQSWAHLLAATPASQKDLQTTTITIASSAGACLAWPDLKKLAHLLLAKFGTKEAPRAICLFSNLSTQGIPMKRRELLAAGAATLAAPWVHAQSSAWPSKGPIRLICQYPPGGLVDTVARMMAPHLSSALSQTVVVDNRAGAGGLIGTEFAARQAADGYNLLVSHASVHIYATATRRSMPFDPVNDFTHMGMLVEAPMLLLVRAQSPYQTLAQYVNAAKTKPVRFGTSGIGSANHLYGRPAGRPDRQRV